MKNNKRKGKRYFKKKLNKKKIKNKK